MFEPRKIDEVVKEHVLTTLEHFGNNKTQAAQALGITFRTLLLWLHKWSLFEKYRWVKK